MPRAARNPSLPQNDDARAQQQRKAQVATTCESYVWTTAVDTLPGVPLATTVPSSDSPTVPWFGLVAEVGLAIVRNVIALKLADARNNATSGFQAGGPTSPLLPVPDDKTTALESDLQRCDEIEKSVAELVKPHAGTSTANLLNADPFNAPPLGRPNLLEEMEDGIEKVEDLARAARLSGHLDELRRMADKHTADAASSLSPGSYEALFETLPLPAIASTFIEDSTFALLRVAGPNPMLLAGIDRLPAHFPVSAESYEKVMGGGDTLARALGEGRVYLLDYVELQALVPGTWDGLPKFPCAPLALFAVPVGGASLKPVAIQCGQDPAQHPIFTPTSSIADQWGWEMAKTVVQFADGNYHELYVHLARTHLVMEAFAVATRRNLADVHPLWALLVPHFEGSLFINNAAANALIKEGGPIDHIFAGTIKSSQATSANDRLAFDFYGKMPPNDLAARSVADVARLPDYPYRDDALLVWKAIRAWAQQYISIYYAADSDVTGDYELGAWVESLATDGKIKGFKAITTREQLVDVCAMIMFTASAQHAAVNFPQKDIMTYAPAVSGAAWTAAPTVEAGHTKPEWMGYMPPISLALEQLNTLYLLGSVHYRALGDYRSNSFPYLTWFRDPAVTDTALPSFQSSLTEVESRIVARNRERLSPYTYLQPSLIPTSINI
jgi:arachidonate 15-lipoxygenase